MSSAIVEALQTVNRPAEGSTPNFAGTKIAGNAVYASVVDVMASSKGLIKEYKRLDGTITQMRTEQPIAKRRSGSKTSKKQMSNSRWGQELLCGM